jgi:ATP-binding protein involved in chromosome partitioning
MSWFTGDDGKRYEIFGSGGGERLAAELDVPLLGTIPLVPEVRVGADEGRPIAVDDPDGEAASAFDAVAERLLATAPRLRTHPELVIS